MKILKKTYLLIMLIAFSGNISLFAAVGVSGTITYQDFYNGLSPYGSWIDYPAHGNVWHPNVADFRPYATNGYWEYTDDGWFWDSDYDWGWAPFHYGSWLYDDSYGWLWIPGYDWAPAWVTWGEYGDYYAWAPIGPGLDLSANWGSWRPDHNYYWNMVKRDQIMNRDLGRHLASQNMVRDDAGKINQISNFQHNAANHYYSVGPDARQVSNYTKREITPMPLKDAGRDAMTRNGRVSIAGNENVKPVYRPQVYTPQPAQTRKVADNEITPVRQSSSWPKSDFSQQRDNIDRLPVREASMHESAPMGGSMREAGFGGGGMRGGGNRR